ncbi:MAG: zinc dependent phospholipase C family protein [Desulfitobacteriaceae bacterium]
MPKELTHWQVARKAFLGQIPDSVKRIISASPHLYYLGAVAHDIPFYDLSEPAEASLERVGNQLHGVNGENTLMPLLGILSEVLRRPGKGYLLSFVLGMLTHFVTDATFHPAVYYLSGNYFDEDPGARAKAVFRHRLLETGIDLWLETLEPLDYPQSLAGLWWTAGARGREAFEILIEHYTLDGDKETKAHFKSAWRYHRFLQAAFKWSVPWRVLRLYRTLGHPGVEKLEALFYPQPLDLSFFQTDFEWSHPVTGEHQRIGLEELFLASSLKVIGLFRELGAGSVADWPGIFRTWEPLSLDSGMAYVPVKEMKYFLAEPIEKALQVKK